MTGDPSFSNAIIEVPQAEAAAGTTKVVWSPTHGPLNVVVPAGTADGTVVWVQTPTAGNVAVTIRVSAPFPPPAPFAGPPASGPPASGPPASGPPASGPPASGPPASGPPASGPPASGVPASGPPASGPPASGVPASGPPAPGYPVLGQPAVPGQPFPGQPFPGQPFPGQPFPGQPYPGQPYPLTGPPQVAPSNARRNSLIGGGLAVVLVLGCCAGVRLLGGGDDGDDKRAGASASAPASAAPLTPEQYVQALAASDTAIGAAFGKLNTADSAAFAKAAPAAAAAIRAESEKLGAVVPPDGVGVAHERLTVELDSMGGMIEDSAAAKQDCPAASPWTLLLQSGWSEGIREDVKKIAAIDPQYKFGGFLPAAPKETKRRLKTGTFIKRSNSGGAGHLKIKNGAEDTTVSLVPAKGKKPKPVLTVYVRGGGTYTARGIRDGSYRVYTASGVDWNAAKKGFTRDCAFSKFDDKFKFTTTSFSSSIWTITLHPVVGGNASTTDVDPNAFPN